MKVYGKVTLEYSSDSLSEGIKIKVVFKLPNQIFKRYMEEWLTCSWYIGKENRYENWDEYWAASFEAVNNKKSIEEKAKSMIVEYIERKLKKTDVDKKRARLEKLIKAMNEENTVVEVEY